jgi:hypothetical protein
MNAEQIARVMAQSVGDPSTGLLADHIPGMAQAVADALNGKDKIKAKPAEETRVVEAEETR